MNDGKKTKSFPNSFELLILVAIACVVVKGAYVALNWKDAWEAFAGMSVFEWLIAVIITSPFLWWYSKS